MREDRALGGSQLPAWDFWEQIGVKPCTIQAGLRCGKILKSPFGVLLFQKYNTAQ
jgi:hypothetical protein